MTISQPSSNGGFNNTNIGQSFINDPSGSGATIKLNDWTFGLNDSTNANTALTRTLSIFLGGGNGGTLVGSSTTTALSSFAGGNSVQWTFAGGLDLIDTSTYTAVIGGTSISIRDTSTNPYANGAEFFGSVNQGVFDTVFQANFSSAAAVPFEFEPTGGLAILGGGWLLRKHLKKKATKV